MIAAYQPLFKSLLLTALLAIIIVFGGLFLLHHVPLVKRDAVANGLLADIVVTLPLAFYFLVVRRYKFNKRNLILVFSGCCAVAWFILPPHQQHYILQLRKLTFLIELGIIIYALSKINKIISVYRTLQSGLPDSAYHLQQSLMQVLGNNLPIKMLATELCLMRYGLLWWKKTKPIAAGYTPYSVHQQSGYASLFGIILFVSLLELTGLHLLLLRYSITAAYIVSALSIYGILFIIGDFAALVKQPILLTPDNQLLLRTGMRWRTVTSLSNITAAEPINENYVLNARCFKGGAMKSSNNILLTFTQPVIIQRLYGKPVTTTQIALSIDKTADFIKQIDLQRVSA